MNLKKWADDETECLKVNPMAQEIDVVKDLEDKYGVTIKQIGYDKWNAMSSAAKFETEGGYECIDVPQNARGIYPATNLSPALVC